MHTPSGKTSPSGVRIADDFRDNLIIDRYDPVFARMRATKLKHLRSENSEDALTWNVFRSLRQIDPAVWLPGLFRSAFPAAASPGASRVTVTLWPSVPPPLSLLEEADEGDSEIDVLIESPSWVWFIEAKFRSDISSGTTTRMDRDQVLRNIDVGSHYAGVRPFYFSLLVLDHQRSRAGAAAVERYGEFEQTRALLRHRPDGLTNLTGVSVITWAHMAAALSAAASTGRVDERTFAERALRWLKERNITSPESVISV